MERKLVLGNPGTGKTYNLVQHINRLIEEGFEPSEITVLSHTRVAAKEIANRTGVKGVQASTIHSLAYKMAKITKEMVVNYKNVKKFSESIGVPMKGNHGDTDDSLEVGDEYLATYNFAEASIMPMQWAYNEKGRPGSHEDFRYFHENYTHWKESYGFVDFNDMLSLALKCEEVPEFPALLIDEAQDLSKKQWEIINLISKKSKSVLVTGDPDQALFTWGGAWQHGMMDWSTREKAEISELNQSFRVPSSVHALSKEIITKVKSRYHKEYKPTDSTGSISRYLSPRHFDFANLDSALILYRSHALRKTVESQLIHACKGYTCLNGFPSPVHNKFGSAVKAWISMQSSEFPDDKDINRIKVVATPKLMKAIHRNDLDAIKGMKAEQAMILPYGMLNYYRRVDFDTADKITLSSIHGAKGMEHDNVILVNGVTQRVMDEAIKNPDPEYQVWYVAVTRSKNKLNIIDGEGVYNPL